MPDSSPSPVAPPAAAPVDYSLPRPSLARHGHRRAPERLLSDALGIVLLLVCLLTLLLDGR